MYRPHTFAVGRPDLGDRLVPVLDQVAAPVAQRHRVVVAQVLLVQHLETDVLDLGDDPPGSGELPVGEHVAVDEPARGRAVPVVVAGDAVVEQQTAGAQLRLQEAEIRRVVRDTDVLGEPDRRDRVELRLADVAVVAVPDLGEVGQPLVGDRLLRPFGLLAGQRHTDRLDAAARCIAHHAAPAASDVEQPVTGLQMQLLEHQPVLVLLRLFQRRVDVRIARARVRHRRTEHPLVERVRHVVVVVDGFGVTSFAVPQPFRDPTPPRQTPPAAAARWA